MKHKDKIKHFLISFIGSFLIGRFMYIPAIGKEIVDEYYYKLPPVYSRFLNGFGIYGTGWSWGDIVADIIGVELGIIARNLLFFS